MDKANLNGGREPLLFMTIAMQSYDPNRFSIVFTKYVIVKCAYVAVYQFNISLLIVEQITNTCLIEIKRKNIQMNQ